MAMFSTRRDFLIGGASAFGAFGAFGGCRFLSADGYKASGVPKLRFGVVSDIHITKVGAGEKMEDWGNNLTFRHALEWFREQGVDAVMIAGDMADNGMVEQMQAVAQAWYAVFPEDKYPDGRPVEKVFATGNHDWIGHTYGKHAIKKYPDKKERVKHVLQADMAGWWEKIFHEPYSPIYGKTVKGYSFIGAHWDGAHAGRSSYEASFNLIEDYMARNGKGIDPSLPFFYVQHPHPKDTCYGPWAWGHDSGAVTKTLSAFPNAIAFSGHSHYTLTDERTIWQGAFTSVGTSSLRYTGMASGSHPPTGYENSGAPKGDDKWRHEAVKMMSRIPTGDCRQGMLWSVYEDCIVVRRREFLSDLDVGEDWVLPLPAAESRPFAFAARAKKLRAPSFPDGVKLKISEVKASNRGGSSGDASIPSVEKAAIKVVAPAAVPENGARAFELEFVAESEGGSKQTKLVVPEGFNHAPSHPKAASPSFCLFAKDELGAGKVRFTVTPVNCFGARGKPLVAELAC